MGSEIIGLRERIRRRDQARQEESDIAELEGVLKKFSFSFDIFNTKRSRESPFLDLESEEREKLVYPENLRKYPGLARKCLDLIQNQFKKTKEEGMSPLHSLQIDYLMLMATAAYTRCRYPLSN